MSKLEKLDLMGVASLGSVAAVLLAGWIATTHQVAQASVTRAAEPQAVSLTQDGSMKLTVTAEGADSAAPAARTRTASVRAATGPSLEVMLPFALRP